MSDVIIQMHIDACILAHHALDCHQILVHPVEVSFLVPDVSVHFLLKLFHFLIIEILLRFFHYFLHKRIAADKDFLGIIGSAGKGRVNINQIHLYALLLEIGTGRKALTMHHQVMLLVGASLFERFHLIERHSSLNMLHDAIVVTIAENAAGAHKIIQEGLPLQGIGII